MSPTDNAEIGTTKVLRRGHLSTSLKPAFDGLDKDYCSLGQSIEYYRALEHIPATIRTTFLRSLNDVVFDRAHGDRLSDDPGFEKSLLRFSEAGTLWEQVKDGHSVLEAFNNPVTDPFAFTFRTQLPGALSSHSLQLRFLDIPKVPNRINVLVGRNGTGKTQLLRRLADAVGGATEDVGVFEPKRPPFSRAIAISYSAFDPFRQGQRTSGESYRYCGIRKPDGGLKDRRDIYASYAEAIKLIHKGSRLDAWHRSLAMTVGPSMADSLVNMSKLQGDHLTSALDTLSLSSGQAVLIALITDVAAYAEPRAVVLIDEPETHLHPNAIGGLMGGLDGILAEVGAFAVLATHSPLILQQIPGHYVLVVRSIDGVPQVIPLPCESFGENLTAITDEVFQAFETPSLFVQWAKERAKNTITDDDAFVSGLSFSARTFIESLRD